MASPQPRPAASSSGDLPPDALFDILLRVPAKELCRLRTVCPSWRALTSDPLFVAEHKSRHAAPLLAIAYRDDNMANGVDFVDLRGDVVRRIPSVEKDLVVLDESGDVLVRIPSSDDSIRVLRTRLGVVCFTREMQPWGLWVLNPATGVTVALPKCRSEELARELEAGYRHTEVESCAFGQVSSTGEYKALRIIRLDLSGSIASFNLETEEWMRTLRGPVPVRRFIQDNEGFTYSHLNLQLSLAELNDCLVTVHNIHNISMDLWFLTGFENGIWVKKYSMPSHVARFSVYPFLVLDDGRILFSHGEGFLQSYDPKTGMYADALEVRDSRSIGIYTGSLLSL